MIDRCHCGWALPATVRIGKLVVLARSESPENLTAEIHVMCPQCGCGFAFDCDAKLASREVVSLPRKGVAQA